MDKGEFRLHNWHGNAKVLEYTNDTVAPNHDHTEPTDDEKILRIPWQKEEDTLQVSFERCVYPTIPLTKRKILAIINGVYDVLGIASPVTIVV